MFCQIVAELAPADIRWQDDQVVAFTPLNPHAPGHILFVPRTHVKDAKEDLWLTAQVMMKASTWARGMPAANIVTSIGSEATQTVFHLHIHVIPRGFMDGLDARWPWG